MPAAATYRARFDASTGTAAPWIIERRTGTAVARTRVPSERLAQWMRAAGLSAEARRRAIPTQMGALDLTDLAVRAERRGAPLADLHALPFEPWTRTIG